MATKKGNSGAKGKGSLGSSGGVYPTVAGRSNVPDQSEHENVPWSLLITVIAVLMTFFIVMPVLGFMYMDMYHATNAAVHEVKKMKELRLQILTERTKE